MSGSGNDKDSSLSVTDPKILQKFIDDSDFPFIVSFPRTGSHWLRMIMELYFERPSLVRIFYYKDRKDYLTLHTHDMNLDVKRKNIIYLYRNPTSTIYSQLNYYKEDINDESKIRYWSNLYGKHLSKWLFEENFTTKKTVLTYENLKKDIYEEFRRVCDHFGCELNKAKLSTVLQKVSKEELAKKTKHDRQVINQSETYQINREQFRQVHTKLVMTCVYTQNNKLKELFSYIE